MDKGYLILSLVVISVALAAAAYALTIGNLTVVLIKTPLPFDAEQRVYTPYCLGECHMVLRFWWDGSDFTLNKNELKTYKTKIVGLDTMTSIRVEYLANITFNESICSQVYNASNSSYYSICIPKEAWMAVWKPIPDTIPIKSGRWYVIDIIGYRNPSTQFQAVDLVPEFKGTNLTDFAWWNSSYTKCRDITNTSNWNASYPSYINLTYDSDMSANYSDVVFVNASCSDDGYSIPQAIALKNDSYWADYRFTSTVMPSSVYYGYPSSIWSKDNINGVYGGGTVKFWLPMDENTNPIPDKVNLSVTCYNDGTSFTASGRKSNAYDFERSETDILQCGDNNDLTTAMTLVAWIKPESVGAVSDATEYGVISKASSGTSGSYQLYLFENGKIKGNIRKGSWCAGAFSTGTVTVGQWNMIAVTYDGTTIRNYLNGVADGTLVCAGTIDNSADNLTIGGFLATTHNFDGIIDEPLIISTVLTPTQIYNLYINAAEPTFSTGSEEVETSNKAPVWSSNTSSTPANYSPSTSSVFDIVWANGSASSPVNTSYVYFESNFSGAPYNYTMSLNSGDMWSGTYRYSNILPAGTFYWKSYAKNNDTVPLWNVSDTWTFKIYNASNPMLYCLGNTSYTNCNLVWNAGIGGYSLDPIGSNIHNTYPTPVNATWGCINANMTRDFVSIPTENKTYKTLGANVSNYEYRLYCYGNANYSTNFSHDGFIINQGIPAINITFNTSDTVVSGTAVLVTGNKPTELNATLYNNTSNVSNPHSFDTTGLLGAYTFIYNTTGNANYTSGTANKTLTVTSSAGLSVSVFDEENTTKALTFNITVNNGTASDTAYNQNNPYFNTSILGSVTIDISSSGYQQRSYYKMIGAGNVTYLNASLLSTGSGSWVIFYVYTATEQPIENALITAERLIPPASWLTVGEKKTDASGAAAIFLSPTTTYRLNFSATGYSNQSMQLQPSASPYVVYMVASSGLNISYNTSYKNIVFFVEPNGTALNANTSYTLRFYVYSSDSSLEYYGWNITYYNGTVLTTSNTTSTTGGTKTYSLNTSIYSTSYVNVNYWFKKSGYSIMNDTKRYYIYNVTYFNTSMMAQIADMAAGVAAGTPDVTMEQFAFISMLISIVCMAAASSQLKMFGSGVIGLMILSMLTWIGTYIWGAAYYLGWTLVGLYGLGVVAAIWIRGGFG